jgi:hypothetical protein
MDFQSARLNETERRSMDASKPTSGAGVVAGTIFWAMAIAGFQALLWLAWFFLMVKTVPLFESVLRESDIPLPIMSQQMIEMSRATGMYWYLLALLGLFIAAIEIALIVSARIYQRTWLGVLRYATVALCSLVPLLLLLYCIVGVTLTIHLINREFASMAAH